MVDPKLVNPLDLPALSLSCSKVFPQIASIYFAVSQNNEILYIGRSLNLRSRWSDHHKQAKLESIGDVRIAWMEVSDSSLLPEIEYSLIKYFQPPLNYQSGTQKHRGLGAKRPNIFTISLSDDEYAIAKRESERRQVPMGELFRDLLKSLEENSKAS